MNTKIVAMMLVSTAALSHAAVLPVSPADDNAAAPAVVPTSSRQGRTLGLLAVGAQAVGTGLSAVVPAAATAAGTVAAVKPMVLLGLGKYALWNSLTKPSNNIGVSVNYEAPEFEYIPSESFFPTTSEWKTVEEIPVDW